MENTATVHVQISNKFITVRELTEQFTNLNTVGTKSTYSTRTGN